MKGVRRRTLDTTVKSIEARARHGSCQSNSSSPQGRCWFSARAPNAIEGMQSQAMNKGHGIESKAEGIICDFLFVVSQSRSGLTE